MTLARRALRVLIALLALHSGIASGAAHCAPAPSMAASAHGTRDEARAEPREHHAPAPSPRGHTDARCDMSCPPAGCVASHCASSLVVRPGEDAPPRTVPPIAAAPARLACSGAGAPEPPPPRA